LLLGEETQKTHRWSEEVVLIIWSFFFVGTELLPLLLMMLAVGSLSGIS